jgi:hypothetical protein
MRSLRALNSKSTVEYRTPNNKIKISAYERALSNIRRAGHELPFLCHGLVSSLRAATGMRIMNLVRLCLMWFCKGTKYRRK